jgi:hypothetical protein
MTVATRMERTRVPSMLLDRGPVWDSGLNARQTAAMNVVKRGVEDDREPRTRPETTHPTVRRKEEAARPR